MTWSWDHPGSQSQSHGTRSRSKRSRQTSILRANYRGSPSEREIGFVSTLYCTRIYLGADTCRADNGKQTIGLFGNSYLDFGKEFLKFVLVFLRGSHRINVDLRGHQERTSEINEGSTSAKSTPCFRVSRMSKMAVSWEMSLRLYLFLFPELVRGEGG